MIEDFKTNIGREFDACDQQLRAIGVRYRLWRALAIAGWVFIALLMCAQLVTPARAAELRPLFDAIRSVETGGHSNPSAAVGDRGRSIGPYQIQRPYWIDSGVPGRYEQVRSQAYAERVMLGYWKRHCPAALARGDYEAMARTHNGGRTGPRKPATLKYWKSVSRALFLFRHGSANVQTHSASLQPSR